MRKLYLMLTVVMSSSLMLAQNSFTNSSVPQSQVTIEDLLIRKDLIGVNSGSVNAHFTKNEQVMLQEYFNGGPIVNFAPQTITQSTSQVITRGIACASHPNYSRDNNMFRVFNLPGDFGITNGFEVNTVEFAIEATNIPVGYDITANIYSTTVGTFPGGTLTLQGTAYYTATDADSFTIVSLPLSATIPAGEAMVMELVIWDGEADGNYLAFGTNEEAQTGPSYIQAAECGANVPTPLTALGLNDAYIWNVIGDDEPGGGPSDSLVFGIVNDSGTLVSFDKADPSVLTTIGTSPVSDFENAGAIDPANPNTAYVLDNSNFFFKVDLTTGSYTNLGSINPGSGHNWLGAEFHPDGTLYAVSGDLAGPSKLHIIDIAGVTNTEVGSMPNTGVISLMIDAAGNGYAHDIVDDAFYKIDLNTGDSTFVGGLGFGANYGQGGTFIPGDDGYVYLSAFNGDTFQSEWRRLDVTTGASTLVGPFTSGADFNQMAWSTVAKDMLKTIENPLVDFSFYPNPVKDVISLKSGSNIESVVFYNTLGQKSLSSKVNSVSKEINVSNLAPGLYIMKVNVNGKTGTYKVIKK